MMKQKDLKKRAWRPGRRGMIFQMTGSVLNVASVRKILKWWKS